MSADRFLNAIRHSEGSPYMLIKTTHEEQQHALALKRQRDHQNAIQQQLRAREAEERERMRLYMATQELLTSVQQIKQRRWTPPAGGLFMGTNHAHVCEGLELDIAPELLREFHNHRHRAHNPVWFTGQEMGVTIGSAGSGKLASAIANNALWYQGSLISVDLKGQLCSIAAEARHRMMQETILLDPFNATDRSYGNVPANGSFNPLDMLDPDVESFPDDAATFAEAISTPPSGSSDAQFFITHAKMLIASVIMFVRSSDDCAGDRTLCQVHRLLCAEPLKVVWLLKAMAEHEQESVRNVATSHQAMAEKTRSGIWAQAQVDLEIFSRPAIKKVTSKSTFRLEDIFERPTSMFLVLDSYRIESHNKFLKMMMAATLLMASRYKNNRPDRRTLWLVDEARQLGPMAMIPQAYRLLRDYGVQIWSFWQTLPDLKATYPNDWESMIGNSFVQLLSCRELETAKYFSEIAGDYKELRRSIGTTRGVSDTTSESFTVGSFGSGGFSRGPGGSTTSGSSGGSSSRTTSTSHTHSFSENSSLSWQWDKRIRPKDLLSMPRDKAFLYVPGELAGFLDKHPYHDDPRLDGLANPNPYYGGPMDEPLFPNPALILPPPEADPF